MELWQWMGLAVAAAMACAVIRAQQPQMAGMCAAAAGLILLLAALEQVQGLRSAFERLAALGGLEEGYLALLLRVLGVSWAAEMAAQTCQDLGENGLALKVTLAGRLCAFSVTVPMLVRMLEMILELVP